MIHILLARKTKGDKGNSTEWIYRESEIRAILSSVIRQKGELQNECFKKTKHAKFSEKQTFLTPWYAHVRENLARFVFLKHPFWSSSFCLITDEVSELQ